MRKMVDEYIALIFEDGEIGVLAGQMKSAPHHYSQKPIARDLATTTHYYDHKSDVRNMKVQEKARE